LDEHRRVAAISVRGMKLPQQGVLEGIGAETSRRGMERRMLDFGVNADGPTQLAACVLRQFDDLGQGGNAESAIVLMGAVGAGLYGAQRSDLFKREITGEIGRDQHAIHVARAPTLGRKSLRDVRGVVEHGFVSGNQVSVARHDQIGFDAVGTLLDGAAVGFERVFRQFARGSSMCDDQRLGQ
jgi:hypothetical protein